MKLVFFIGSSRNIGGGDYAQFVFAHELSKLGHEVSIFAGDRNFYSPELDKSKVKTHYRRTIPIFIKRVGLGKLNKLWDNIYTQVVMKPWIKKNQPDVLIGYLRDSAIKAQELGEQYNIKVANFVFENPQWMKEDLKEVWEKDWAQDSFRNSWLKTKVAYEKSDILIPNSILSGKKMKEWIPKANISEQVYPAVKVPPKKDLKRTIDVIYIGRLNKLKNVDDLLHALKPEWKTVIIGTGEEEENLKKLAEELGLDVEFKGGVSNAKKWSLLAKSKVLAFPTSHEGFGMPPLEALAYGCNVVCSNLPILHEVYGNEVTYVPLHDISQLRKQIAISLQKPEAKTKLHEKYTLEKATKTIEKILKRLLR